MEYLPEMCQLNHLLRLILKVQKRTNPFAE